MSNKSKYLPPIITRNGLNYPRPGSWMRNVSFNKLAILAKNLNTTESKTDSDKLHSVPTPWARLLLFETALFEKDHPAHHEVRSQWRGLLGLIGLANLLGLDEKIKVRTISLQAQRQGDLKDTFEALRPRHVERERDQEKDKWDTFGMIFVDEVLIGGTSPRTLVFTGISHQCPLSVPFRSAHNKLIDPAEYYRVSDPVFLGALSRWVDNLIEVISGNDKIIQWLGEGLTDPNAKAESRGGKILGALREWKSDIGVTGDDIEIVSADHSRLPAPYDFIKHVENAKIPRESDLFLEGRTDMMIMFRPGANSFFVDAHGNQLTGHPVNVFRGHSIPAGQPLPQNVNYIPTDITVVEDPQTLLEDRLIEVQIIDPKAVSCLSLEKKNYLLPFNKKVTELFTESELKTLVQRTHLQRIDASTIRVEVRFPLVRGRSIKVQKDYVQGQSIITNDNLDHPTQELAMWPDFICLEKASDEDEEPVFSHYFYYTSDTQEPNQIQVAFSPLGGEITKRDFPQKGRSWYMSKTPLLGFVGAVGDKQGLLLINYNSVGKPSKNWKVGVDFGSTHTSVFYREVDPQGDGSWLLARNSVIKPLHIEPRVRILTQGEAAQIQENFFLYRASAAAAVARREIALTTQLSMPLGYADYQADNWLPREGQIYLGSVLDGAPPALETDLKWNSDRNNHTISAFLRSLLMMIKAEAVRNGASVATVAHAYPSAFSDELELKHSEEWNAVERCVGAPIDQEPLSEAVAVCRHLWREQRALPMANMIAMDVGGSTTDIAVWSNGPLQAQESIKMAAGAASRYVESSAASGFRQWLLKKLSDDEPFRSKRIVHTGFSADDLTRRTYHAVLKRLSDNGQMDSFIKVVKVSAKSSPEVQTFLSPMVVILAAVSYFAGLLIRKVLQKSDEEYYVFFCGKGGQLLRWIPEGESVVKEIFTAGVTGPGYAGAKPSASIKISAFPKEEVGRGLLIDHTDQVNLANNQSGIFTEAAATVTVAEEGYKGLHWNESLSYEKLSEIKESIPPVEALGELNNFINVFSASVLTGKIAAEHDMKELIRKPLYRATLRQRISDNLAGGREKALIESLFITEAKVLVELITGQDDLFD
jgi:hypothetical protein